MVALHADRVHHGAAAELVGLQRDLQGLRGQRHGGAKGIFWGACQADMNLLFSTSTDGVPYLLMETVCIAILGTVVGGILALPISFLASPRSCPSPSPSSSTR